MPIEPLVEIRVPSAVTSLSSPSAVRIFSATTHASVLLGLGQDDRELVAPVSDGYVGRAQSLSENVPHVDQQLVTDGVPVAVVDLLEVVKVDHRERELGPVALRTCGLLVDALVEGATIAEPGQRIACGPVGHLGALAHAAACAAAGSTGPSSNRRDRRRPREPRRSSCPHAPQSSTSARL